MITTETKSSKKSTVVKILIIAVFIIGGLVCAYKLGTQNVQVTHVSYIFVDVDNDGKQDLIVSGDVIFNSEQNSNFLASQPKHP